MKDNSEKPILLKRKTSELISIRKRNKKTLDNI